jgi:bifunctional UDP-N-acetylglucosamine pyrophosphorylase/glucosamine-1-phosphate N-acetyltransferase
MTSKDTTEIQKLVDKLSSPLDKNINEIAIILAAGHGKRIKSQRSKMLHKIWEIPTVERVYKACRKGIENINIIIVVGIKADDVMNVFGKRSRTLYAYQEVQNGTGHAVQVALDRIDNSFEDGIVYVLPGDMGLIDDETIQIVRKEFINNKCDMTVLTGLFEGKAEDNSYGRIIRVKEKDAKGNPSGSDFNKVIEIKEQKDIFALAEDENYNVEFNRRVYSFTKKELINNPEFNSGVYAFKYKKLKELIGRLSSNNVQNEIYLTDLISLFNEKGYTVTAVSPSLQHVVMGFNNKSVLKEMEAIARKQVYDRLKDTIEITDPDDFFIDEEVVEQIIKMDKGEGPLDITIGKGVYIGRGVKLNHYIELKKNVFVDGNVHFGKNAVIWQNAHLSTFSNQQFIIGNNVEILWGDIIKGNIVIGDNSKIESSVNMTGSDEFPLRIGENVLIKGTSYIFGSILDDGLYIENSIIIKKKVSRIVDKNGNALPIRFYIPHPEGVESIKDL